MFCTVAFAVFRIHDRKLLGVLMFSLCFPVPKWEHGYGRICHGMSCATHAQCNSFCKLSSFLTRVACASDSAGWGHLDLHV
jgi:hypothetical protein